MLFFQMKLCSGSEWFSYLCSGPNSPSSSICIVGFSSRLCLLTNQAHGAILYGPACHSIINVMLIVLVVTKPEFLARCVTASSGCIYIESSTITWNLAVTHNSHDSQLLGSHPAVPYQAAPEKQSWTRYINFVSSFCLCKQDLVCSLTDKTLEINADHYN